MIKLVALDMDGTLLSDDKTICGRNRDAVAKAREKDVVVALCSGRSYGALRRELEELELNVPNQYGIGLNGCIIFRNEDGQNVYTQYMAPEMADELIELGRRVPNLRTQVYDEHDVYVDVWGRTAEMYEQITHQRPVVVKDLSELRERCIKVSFFIDDPELTPDSPLDKGIAMRERLEKALPEGAQAVISAPYLIECIDGKSGKGVGLMKLAEMLNLTREEVMACGDLENDISMLEAAGLSVAMKNGAEAVRQVADYITEVTNNEGGVAEAIEKFVL